MPSNAVYCPHHSVLEAWIDDDVRVVVVNVSTREQALEVLQSVRAQLRREESDEMGFTMTLRFHGDGGRRDRV